MSLEQLLEKRNATNVSFQIPITGLKSTGDSWICDCGNDCNNDCNPWVCDCKCAGRCD